MNTPQQFSASGALRLGFEKYSREAGYCWCVIGGIELICLISAFVCSFHLVLVSQLLFQLDAPPLDSYIVACAFAYLVVRTAAQPIVSSWLLSFAEGNKQSVDELLGFDLAKHLPVLFKNAASSLVVSAYVVTGSVIMIIPGVIAAASLRFYKFLVLDDNEDAITALRSSYELSTGNLGQLVCLQLLSLAIRFGGFLLFGIGLIPALAVCGLAEACAYNELKATRQDD